jgi:predicted phage-related endonuclease
MNSFKYINHDTWLKNRHDGIGASDIPILCGASNFMTPYELWEQKTEKKEREVSDNLQKYFDSGHEQEPITLYRFLKSRDNELAEKVLLKHLQKKHLPKKGNCHIFTEFKKNKFMYAHPDMIFNDCNIEAKFVKHKGSEWDFSYKEFDNNYGTKEDIPFKYYLQVQYQMMCTGLDESIVVVNYQGLDHYEFLIESDHELFKVFEKICTDFWNLVQTKTPPMPSNREDVKKLFGKCDETSLTLDDEMSIHTILMKHRFKFIKDRIKKYEKEKEKIKNSVLMLMGKNSVIQTPTGEKIAYVSISKPSERIASLSSIKKQDTELYELLKEKGFVNTSQSERFIF